MLDSQWQVSYLLPGSSANGKMRDGSFDYYVSEPVVTNDLKGVGPFIMAGIEMQSLTVEAGTNHLAGFGEPR